MPPVQDVISTITVKSTVTRTAWITAHRTNAASTIVGPTSTFDVYATAAPVPHGETSTACLPSPSDVQGYAPGTPNFQIPPTTAMSISPSDTSLPSTNATAPVQDNDNARKHAIIGGLSGSVAGLFMIGALLFFFLRMRRKRREQAAQLWGEKEHSNASWLARPRAPLRQPRSTSISVDEEHLIHINTEDWARPFVQGRGEGIRDSYAPAQLRVMNPDEFSTTHSTPSAQPVHASDTPDSAMNSPGTFLKKQRSALVAALYAGSSRASSLRGHNRPLPPLPQSPQPVVNQRGVSRSAPPMMRPRSSRSTMSTSTTVIVTQKPPEDPFVTPSNCERARTRQLSVASTHSGASRPSASTRSMFNPLRSWQRRVSQSSSSTIGSSGYSDPFDLDNRSLSPLDASPNWTVYEGT